MGSRIHDKMCCDTSMIEFRIEEVPDSTISRLVITDDNDTGIMATFDY